MKKSLILLIVAVFLIAPSVSFAKEIMTDNELGAISGEAGVTITFDSIFFPSGSSTPTQRTPFALRFTSLLHTIFHPNTQTNNTGAGNSFTIGLLSIIQGGLTISAHGAP